MSNNKIKVEKGIPIPTSRFPFNEMEVGDSFLFPCEPENYRSAQNTLTTYISLYRRKNLGAKFRTSRVEGGVRVWLLKKGEKF